jgi:hypothetical protein
VTAARGGRQPAVARQPRAAAYVNRVQRFFYKDFWNFFLNFFKSPLEVLNLPSLMDFGDFIFFQILFLLNLEYTWTFISTIGIFVS